MARTTKNIGFTVPPDMAVEFERVAREEGSTKSELFRRMFRLYRVYRKQAEHSEKAHLERLFQQGRHEVEESMRPETANPKEGGAATREPTS